jgi:hypothetical protein
LPGKRPSDCVLHPGNCPSASLSFLKNTVPKLIGMPISSCIQDYCFTGG